MGSDLKPLLKFDTLTGVVRTFFDQSKNRVLSREYFRRKKPIMGEMAKWHRLAASREPAPFAGRTGTAIATKLMDVDEEKAAPASIRVFKEIKGHELFLEGWPSEREGDGLQLLPNAQQKISDELQDLVNQVTCSLEIACRMACAGSIVIDATNFPGSKTVATVSFSGVQTLTAGGAYLSDASKKIVTDETTDKPSVFNMKRKLQDNAGLALGPILMNAKMTAQARRNTELQNLVRGSIPGAPVVPNVDQINTALAGERARIVEYDGNYTLSGTVTRILPDDKAICLPENFEDILELHEGYEVVPAGGNVIGTEGRALELMRLRTPGIASYAVLNPDPPISVKLYVLYTFLPVLKYDKGVVYATLN